MAESQTGGTSRGGRSVVVTGATIPLGRRVIDFLHEAPWVSRVVGIESAPDSGSRNTQWIDGVALVGFERDPRRLVSLFQEFSTDTVVHCAAAGDRGGAASVPSGSDVIGTLRLGAAISDAKSSVRAWVVASSSDVYPVSSYAPLLYREDAALVADEDSIEATLVEAEGYARDVAEHLLHCNVSLMRLAPVVGSGVRTPFGGLLAERPLPVPLGFDPALQLLHIDDAVEALCFAAENELAGAYNVASTGLLRWSEVPALLDCQSVAVPPVPIGPLAALTRRLGVPWIPGGLTQRLRLGHAVDVAKLTAAGFRPARDQRDCLRAAAEAV